MVDLAREVVGGSVAGVRFGVLGAAFKPGSDDVRDSPALDVAAALHRKGAVVVVHDPKAIENAHRRHPELSYVESASEALRGADAVLLLTHWPEYVSLDPEAERHARRPAAHRRRTQRARAGGVARGRLDLPGAGSPLTRPVRSGRSRSSLRAAAAAPPPCRWPRRAAPPGSRASGPRAPASEAPRMRTASRPALRAPPTDTVATGTPGRHLHDRQQRVHAVEVLERRPARRSPAAGSPTASMPGRWAAPPAPAMITRSPRSAAVRPYSIISLGIRCAETTSTSYGTPNSASASAAASITGQSESLPMTTPTSGVRSTPHSSMSPRR